MTTTASARATPRGNDLCAAEGTSILIVQTRLVTAIRPACDQTPWKMYTPCPPRTPTDQEVLGEPLSKLARRYGIPRSTLWTRCKALQRHEVHRSTCASLCTNWDDDLDNSVENPTAIDKAMGRSCHIHHACWCDDGALTYLQYIAKQAAHSYRGAMPPMVRSADSRARSIAVERLELLVNRLAAVGHQVAEAQAQIQVALRARRLIIPACTHAAGHTIRLRPDEALSIETFRDCPCCGARLWVNLPSTGELLEAAADDDVGLALELQVMLTRREEQLLNILRKASHPVRLSQLAALIWSDAARTHDARSLVCHVRRKLRNSNWTIPIPVRGGGIQLVAATTQDSQTILELAQLAVPNHHETALPKAA